ARFGVRDGCDVRVALASVFSRKDGVVRSSSETPDRQVERIDRLPLFEAEGRFLEPGVIGVGNATIRAERVVINTGARPTRPDVEGLADVPYLTSRGLLDVTDLPEHLVVVGGGYVGCEVAQMFRRFGSRVTLVQRGPHLLPGEDPAAADVIADVFSE